MAVALDAQVNSMPKAVSAIHDPLMRAASAPLSLMATPTLLNAMFSMETRLLSVCASIPNPLFAEPLMIF